MKKDYIILYIFLFFSLFAVIVGCLIYSNTFGISLSPDHQRWGEFGSYFGVILGVISSLGIFMTLYYTMKINRENSKNIKWDHIRDFFFKQVEIYNKTSSGVNISGITGEPAFCYIVNDIRIHLITYLIYRKFFIYSQTNEIKRIDSFPDLYDQSVLIELGKLLNNTEIEPIEFNFNQLYNLKCLWDNINTLRQTGQRNFVRQQLETIHKKGELEIYLLAEKIEKKWIDRDFSTSMNNWVVNYFHNPNVDIVRIFKGYQYAGHILNTKYGPQTGAYMRVVYNILDITSVELNMADTDNLKHNIEKLKKLFKAQIGKYEAAALFFNKFSGKATKRTIQLYNEFDVFNNIDDFTIGINQLPDNIRQKLFD